MARTVDAAEARERIDEWLREVERDGEPLTLARDGLPVARLEAVHSPTSDESESTRRTEALRDLDRIRAEVVARNGGVDVDPVQIIREGREERDRQFDEILGLPGRELGPGPRDEPAT